MDLNFEVIDLLFCNKLAEICVPTYWQYVSISYKLPYPYCIIQMLYASCTYYLILSMNESVNIGFVWFYFTYFVCFCNGTYGAMHLTHIFVYFFIWYVPFRMKPHFCYPIVFGCMFRVIIFSQWLCTLVCYVDMHCHFKKIFEIN